MRKTPLLSLFHRLTALFTVAVLSSAPSLMAVHCQTFEEAQKILAMAKAQKAMVRVMTDEAHHGSSRWGRDHGVHHEASHSRPTQHHQQHGQPASGRQSAQMQEAVRGQASHHQHHRSQQNPSNSGQAELKGDHCSYCVLAHGMGLAQVDLDLSTELIHFELPHFSQSGHSFGPTRIVFARGPPLA